MTTTPSRESPQRRAEAPVGRSVQFGRPLKAAATAASGYALLLALLVLVIYLEDHSVLIPLVVLSAVGFASAVLTVTLRRRWTAWPVAIYALVVLAADGPHQVPAILHPDNVAHAVGGIILILAGLATFLIAVRAALQRPTPAGT